MAWQPEKQRLLQITQLLKNVKSPVRDTQQTSLQMLAKLNLISDFNNYLIFILAKYTSEDEIIRIVSGNILKKIISTVYETLRSTVIEFVKSECLAAVGDTSPAIRAIVGFLITKIASHGINTWPELLPTLYQMLDAMDCNVCEVALGVLQNIFEDSSDCLENDRKNKPLDILIPKCLKLFKHSSLKIKLSANKCIDQLISRGSHSLINHSDVFLENFFHLPVDDATEVRKTVCKAIVLIIEVRKDRVFPHLHKIIEFMLLRTQNRVENIALEGCMFWELMADQKICIHVLAPYLTTLIPILISRMRYSEIEIISLQEEDENVPNNLQVTSLFGLNNLRTFSTAALGKLANVFKEDILPIVMPILKETFSSTECVVKEYGILVIGTIAKGCMNGMIPHLHELIPYMINYLNDNNPLVRATICRTLSCYCHWIVDQPYHQYYKPMILELLNQMLNANNRVQEAACSAFAILEEATTTNLLPFLEIILKTFVRAYYKYQHKNLLILYNTIGTLALSVGHNLNKPEYINILMPPLIEKLNALNNEDEDLVPVLQCLSRVTAALQSRCMPFADQLFKRCISVVEQTLNQIRDNYLDPGYWYAELKILAALNQLSVLTNELPTFIERLINGSNTINLLYMCMQNPSNDIRQCSFFVLGNLAKSCFKHVYPLIDDFMPILAQNLNADLFGCNSATRAIGEIAVQLGTEMQQYVPIIVNELVLTMNLTDTSRHLLQTAANTIGQLCDVCPHDIYPLIQQIVRIWFYTLDNSQEMTCNKSAFMRMCQTLSLSPCKIVQDFLFFCHVVASGKLTPKDEDMFYKVLHHIKKQLGEGNWSAVTDQFPQQLKVYISTAYRI